MGDASFVQFLFLKAKNLILAGPRSVTIHDDGLAEIADLGRNVKIKTITFSNSCNLSFCIAELLCCCLLKKLLTRFVFHFLLQYYLTESHIGQPRGPSVTPRLAELNPYVRVTCHTGEVGEELLSQFKVVVFTDTPRADLIRLNEFCRNQSPPIGFIAADVR